MLAVKGPMRARVLLEYNVKMDDLETFQSVWVYEGKLFSLKDSVQTRVILKTTQEYYRSWLLRLPL